MQTKQREAVYGQQQQHRYLHNKEEMKHSVSQGDIF